MTNQTQEQLSSIIAIRSDISIIDRLQELADAHKELDPTDKAIIDYQAQTYLTIMIKDELERERYYRHYELLRDE